MAKKTRTSTKTRVSRRTDALPQVPAQTGTSRADPTKLERRSLARVLVAVDFSKMSETAMERAVRLPLGGMASIELLSVLPSDSTSRIRSKLKQDLELRLEQAAKAMRKNVRKAGQPEVVVTTHLAAGQPFVEIVRRSRQIEAELIVLGKHGRRPVRDLLIGSTAAKVIRHSDLPVLIVTRDAKKPYCRPLLATALDDASGRTLAFLLRLLDPLPASGTVVHAYNVPFAGFIAPRASSRERAEWDTHFRGEAEAGLRSFLARHQRPNLAWKQVVRSGDPRVVIKSELARRRADLVALGTHARTGVAHALLGSVAEWVVAEADCDVLIARPIRFSFELV